VAALATCYVSTFSDMAETSKFAFALLEVEAEAILEKDENGWRFTEVQLRPVLKIAREQDREWAERLLAKVERSCLVARSISPRVTLEPIVSVVPESVGSEAVS
jgi:organic hydroperoxide reductase OsmC/OhrA